MELEASLKLLKLPPDASIDDTSKAYAALHEEINRFHQDPDKEPRGDYQEDIELLTCAYENAVALLSHIDSKSASEIDCAPGSALMAEEQGSFDDPVTKIPPNKEVRARPRAASNHPHPDHRTVEEAILITSRRLRETESALPGAQRAVDAAKRAIENAKRRVESAKKANLNAIVSAKAAKIRALLLDAEAKKAVKTAHVVAEKARARAVVARKTADEAGNQAEQVKEQVIRAKKSEEAATAEAVCAEDRMERELARLKTLEHKLLETRNCMRMFQETTSTLDRQDNDPFDYPVGLPVWRDHAGKEKEGKATAYGQILSEIQNMKVFADVENQKPTSETIDRAELKENDEPECERRLHPRIVYPMDQTDQHPHLISEGRSIPILDMSAQGIRLESTDGLDQRIVRGSIELPGQTPLKVTGRVLRRGSDGMGVKLVTRIGTQVLNRERQRLAV